MHQVYKLFSIALLLLGLCVSGVRADDFSAWAPYGNLESLTLPVAATQVANRQVQLTGYKMYSDGVDEVPSDPFAYVDFNDATPKIKFHKFGTLGTPPATYTAVLNISGSYEVAP